MQFVGVYVLHPEELKYKLDHGTDAIFDRFRQGEVTELVDVQRPSVV